MQIVLPIVAWIVTAIALITLVQLAFHTATVELDDDGVPRVSGVRLFVQAAIMLFVVCAMWFWCGLKIGGVWP